MNESLSVLNWNVSGLNSPNRHATVHETIAGTPCNLVCLQETKLSEVNPFIASFLGGQRLKNFAKKPAHGTKGGILLLWNEDYIKLDNISVGNFSISAKITLVSTSTSFKFTSVYGPTRSNLKDAFFQELLSLKPQQGTRWLVAGDFNQIYRACDKNRSNVDRSRLVRFRNALNSSGLKEIHLQNRKYTGSNEQANPTLSKLDSFFCNDDWDVDFGSHILHALSSSLSDHCPLLITCDKGPKRPKTFRFEKFMDQDA